MREHLRYRCGTLLLILLQSLSLGGCCSDCAQLSRAGAVSFQGPATPSIGAAATKLSTNRASPANSKSLKPSDVPAGADPVATAFYVNGRGQLLTTWEAVSRCSRLAILVDYEFRNVKLAAGNPISGLAILETGEPATAHAIFRTISIAEGETASAIAYPIADGLFMPLEIASGPVRTATALKGFNGILAMSTAQDSQAPGGPIVDQTGDAIGMTVPRLSTAWPQDVRYGFSNELILKFLAATAIPFSTREIAGAGDATPERGTAPPGGDYTVPVLCFR